MFKGFIISESLKNPLILNNLETIKVNVEYNEGSENEPKIWHIFKVNINDNKINDICDNVSKEIKEGWYAHFWNENTLYAILSNKIFKISRENNILEPVALKEYKNYAIKNGVEEKYVDFLIED